jgi:hypothetical protein
VLEAFWPLLACVEFRTVDKNRRMAVQSIPELVGEVWEKMLVHP